MSKNIPKYGVFLGRFQPFHIGHMSIIDKILETYDRLLLVIGSSNVSGTETNPWTLQEREEIIRATIPLELQEKIDIVGLEDVPSDDEWGEALKRLLQGDLSPTPLRLERGISSNSLSLRGGGKGVGFAVFTGNPWTRDICEHHGIETSWIDSYDIDISATRIREMLQDGQDVSAYTSVRYLPSGGA